MAIRSIAQLKAWFRRGKYPTEEQFADWLDSFIHQTEGDVTINRIKGLAEALRNKYPQTAGAELERLQELLRADFDAHKGLTESWLGDIVDDVDAAETKIEQHQTDIEQLAGGLNEARSDIATVGRMLGNKVLLSETEEALAALGPDYASLLALAVTLKTFLQSNDTADSTINTWREIESFLQGITDTDSLTALLAGLRDECGSLINTEKARAETAEEALALSVADKVANDDSRLSDPREANGGFADSISNRRDSAEHYCIWVGTQAEYDAIETKEATTIYYTL